MPSFSISLRRSSAWRRARALIVVGERRRRSRFDRRLPSGTKSIASRVARCSGVGRALRKHHKRFTARFRTDETSRSRTVTPGSRTLRSTRRAVARFEERSGNPPTFQLDDLRDLYAMAYHSKVFGKEEYYAPLCSVLDPARGILRSHPTLARIASPIIG